MPRSTHPEPRHQHSREDVRAQRARYIRKRWRRNKDLYRVEEGSGALVVDMNNPRVLERCSSETLQELAGILGQEGPLLFLHPEALKRAPKELRRSVEKCLGLKVLGRNELAEGSSAHDRVLDSAVVSRHAERPAPARAKEKRRWRAETAAETGG